MAAGGILKRSVSKWRLAQLSTFYAQLGFPGGEEIPPLLIQ
jgi:hypothetical protein